MEYIENECVNESNHIQQINIVNWHNLLPADLSATEIIFYCL